MQEWQLTCECFSLVCFQTLPLRFLPRHCNWVYHSCSSDALGDLTLLVFLVMLLARGTGHCFLHTCKIKVYQKLLLFYFLNSVKASGTEVSCYFSKTLLTVCITSMHLQSHSHFIRVSKWDCSTITLATTLTQKQHCHLKLQSEVRFEWLFTWISISL